MLGLIGSNGAIGPPVLVAPEPRRVVIPLAAEIDPGAPATVSGADAIVKAWVGQRLGIDDFGPSMAIGVVLDEALIAGVVYNHFHRWPSGATLEASIAADTPRWATRAVLRDLFWYPFRQLGVTRLGVRCRKKAKAVRRFNERLGFKMEGVMRRGYDGRDDAISYSMLPDECRWING